MVCIFIDRYKDLRGRDVNCWQNNGKFILTLLSLVAFDSEKIKTVCCFVVSTVEKTIIVCFFLDSKL